MFIALRDGQFDYLFDDTVRPDRPARRAAPSRPRRATPATRRPSRQPPKPPPPSAAIAPPSRPRRAAPTHRSRPRLRRRPPAARRAGRAAPPTARGVQPAPVGAAPRLDARSGRAPAARDAGRPSRQPASTAPPDRARAVDRSRSRRPRARRGRSADAFLPADPGPAAAARRGARASGAACLRLLGDGVVRGHVRHAAAAHARSAGRPHRAAGARSRPASAGHRRRRRSSIATSSGRYAPSRPAAIFATTRPPEGASIFGEDLISEKSLDEVILSYLAEDLDAPRQKK